MKRTQKYLFVFVISLLAISTMSLTARDEVRKPNEINYVDTNLKIHEGLVSTTAQRIKVKRNRKNTAVIKLTAPKIISMASQPEKWGYYQFPSISETDDGNLVVRWAMQADSHTSYGKKSPRAIGPMMSANNGRNWNTCEQPVFLHSEGYRVELRNGDVLMVSTPASKDIFKYNNFPKPVARKDNQTYYYMKDLPETFQGVYLNYRDAKTGNVRAIHAKLNDPGLLRNAIDGLMSVVWWGNIRELSDGSLIAGMYPSFYLDKSGKLQQGCVSFYKSIDRGETWDLQGVIPFALDKQFDKREESKVKEGFTEPAFDVLEDGTLICVLRTGAVDPMYECFSKDNGKTWSKPVPFTPNGVKPTFLRLDNGVLVLASGRPGLQIRFSLDGTGREWTEPIDMVKFMDDKGGCDIYASCGYPSLLKSGRNSFYLVYSDFHEKNEQGEDRKAIKFRKITVRKR